jgi:Uma2 family endonuclease
VGEPVQRKTYAEYLAFEREAETKHEFVDGQIVAMAGGTPEHSRLAASVIQALGTALRGRRCSAFSSDLRVHIPATGRSTYPDVTVVCDERLTADVDADAIINPTVIVEILSPRTEASDRGEKFAHYRRIESLQEYVLVGQDEQRIEVYRREGDVWALRDYGPGQEAELASLDVRLAVDAIYADPLG